MFVELIHRLGKNFTWRVLDQPGDQSLDDVFLHYFMRYVPGRHADNFASNELLNDAFGLWHRKELPGCHQRRGCTHALIVLALTASPGGD